MSSALELLRQALEVKEDMEAGKKELRNLGVDAVKLLADSEAASAHAQTRVGYTMARTAHDRFINQMLELSGGAGAMAWQFRAAHFQTQTREVLDKLGAADPGALADEELLSLRKRARDTVMSAPDTIAAAMASVYISEFSLAIAHANTLAAYLNRPSVSSQAFDAAGKLLKAAILDLGGSAFPFLGTAEVLFQLTTAQIVRDQERMRAAVEQSDRLWFFSDQMGVLVGCADVARGGAQAALEAITDANARFDEDSQWLIDTLGAAPSA